MCGEEKREATGRGEERGERWPVFACRGRDGTMTPSPFAPSGAPVSEIAGPVENAGAAMAAMAAGTPDLTAGAAPEGQWKVDQRQ